MTAMTRRSHLLALAALTSPLSLPLEACSPKPAATVTPIAVQLAIYPGGTDGYLFMAQQKGWFKDAGLDVDIADGRGSNYAMQVLTSGHADIGSGTLPPLVFARLRGAKAVAIAEFWPDLGPAVIAAKSAGITTPADLKGKRVAVAAAGPWPPLLPSFLEKFGLKESDLNLMYVDINTLFSTYISKQADAILSVDTAITETGPYRESVVLKASNYGVDLPGTGLYATQDLLAGPKGEAVSRFLAVCVKSLKYMYDGHEDEAAAAIIAMRPSQKLSKEVLLSQIALYKARFLQLSQSGVMPGAMDAKQWADQIDYMKSIGMLKGDLNPADMFTNAYLPKSGQ